MSTFPHNNANFQLSSAIAVWKCWLPYLWS